MKTPTARKAPVRRGGAPNTQKPAPLRDHYRLAPSSVETGTPPLGVKQLAGEPPKVKGTAPAPSPSPAPALTPAPTLASASAPSPFPTPTPATTATSSSTRNTAPILVAASTPTPTTPASPVVPTSQAMTPVSVATHSAEASVARDSILPTELAKSPAVGAKLEKWIFDSPDAPHLLHNQQQKVAAPPAPKEDLLAATLQHRFEHFSLGFDALAVVLQHTLKTVEILERNEKHTNYNTIKCEWENSKLLIDDMKENISVLESSLEEKVKNLILMSTKYEELARRNEDLIHEKEKFKHETFTTIAALENKCQIQEERNSQYTIEKAELIALQTEKENKLIHEFRQKEQKNKQEHETCLAQLQLDISQREDIWKNEMSKLRDDHERVKKQLAIFAEADNKDGRLQASLARCGELEEEVRSLQSVLELRHQELQELRKNNGSLTRQAEQLPSALQRITALEARVEDLQAQLKEKGDVERQAAQQHCALVEALQKEVNQKNRLTLLTEELQWKLKQNSEVFSALVAMNGTSANVQVPSTSGTSSPAVSRRNTNGSLHSISESASSAKTDCETPSRMSVSLMKRVNNSSHQTLRSDTSDEISSPPSSPKIKGIVEKNDSVSWVLDMEETSEELVSRLVRRGGSFRGTTPPPSGSILHAQTLPTVKHRYKSASLSLSSSSSSVFRRSNSKNDNTVSYAEQDHDRTENFSSGRSRSRSVSADSVDSVDIINWGHNISDYTKIPESNHGICSQNNKILISVKSVGNKTFIPHSLHNKMNLDLTNNLSSELQKHASENRKHNWNCNMPDFSNDESPIKSSGSSAYTSSDEDVRNNVDGKNIVPTEHYCHKQTSAHLPNGVPFNGLNICGSPNTADLSLLAACAAVQPALMPKDAAGEAMISEETSEDENDRDEVDDNDETVSSSITRSASENEEEDDENFMNI